MTEYKLCPLKGSNTVEMMFTKDGISEYLLEKFKASPNVGVQELPDGTISVEFAGGLCATEDCAWWDAVNECCCIKSMARKKG